MCRTGGRRCPNAGGRSTQNTRQAMHRARTALSAAEAGGDEDAITQARQRLDKARAAHQEARNAMNHDHNPDDTAAHTGDVTADHTVVHHDKATTVVVNNSVTNSTGTVYQAAVINGPITFTSDPDDDRDRPPRHARASREQAHRPNLRHTASDDQPPQIQAGVIFPG